MHVTFEEWFGTAPETEQWRTARAARDKEVPRAAGRRKADALQRLEDGLPAHDKAVEAAHAERAKALKALEKADNALATVSHARAAFVQGCETERQHAEAVIREHAPALIGDAVDKMWAFREALAARGFDVDTEPRWLGMVEIRYVTGSNQHAVLRRMEAVTALARELEAMPNEWHEDYQAAIDAVFARVPGGFGELRTPTEPITPDAAPRVL